ncbi:hypothetical protein O6P43_020295 [Quillaja saponaria]|uniref:Uncharacterized protein n=1 Tax=Quillaja saponaria TaxID=32244 RepID=A0AAD7LM02_QUISA|nr:hypothetical protein O6P43_020295 [Quillaja saponaria]
MLRVLPWVYRVGLPYFSWLGIPPLLPSKFTIQVVEEQSLKDNSLGSSRRRGVAGREFFSVGVSRILLLVIIELLPVDFVAARYISKIAHLQSL